MEKLIVAPIQEFASTTGSSELEKDQSKYGASTTRTITSHSFKSRIYSRKWTDTETRLFLRALGLFGTDFSMITLMFKGRSRSQIINKFHKEEKQRPSLVEQAIKCHNTGKSRLLKSYGRLFEKSQEDVHIQFSPQRERFNSGNSLDSVDNV